MDEDVRVTDIRAAVALPALYARDEKTAEQVLKFFAAQNPEQEHPQGLRAGRRQLCDLVRGARDIRPGPGPDPARRRLHRGAFENRRSSLGKAQARSIADALRLPGRRPGGAS